MDSGGALRRSSRAAAKAAVAKLRSVAAGSGGAEPSPPSSPAEAKPRKRGRPLKRAAEAPAEPAAEQPAAAKEPAAEGSGGAAAVKKRGAGRKRAAAAAEEAEPTKAKAAAAGPSREFEEELWQAGFAKVAGVDEAGRGPLAGPVVAAACVVPPHVAIPGIDDSKKLSEAQREEIYAALTTHPEVRWATQVIEADEIDSINILQAALKAMEGAAAGLQSYDYLLVDGNRLPKGFDPERSRTIVKGDSRCYAIAAASIIAKVTRDRLMEQYHLQYPQYNFGQHKGYGVPAHVEAIRTHGPCAIHRRSFAPVKHWFPAEPAGGNAE